MSDCFKDEHLPLRQSSDVCDDGVLRDPKLLGDDRLKQKPAVSPKPKLDSYHFSANNVRDSAENDLDILIKELCELESQLKKDFAPDKMFSNFSVSTDNNIHSNNFQINKSTNSISSQHLQKKVSENPDGDSAFDSSSILSCASLLSSSLCNRSNASLDQCSGISVTTSSPTLIIDQISQADSFEADDVERIKAQKIQLAMEKMREASIKKLYVKFYLNDNISKSILVDERWTVRDVLQILSDKFNVGLTANYCVIENYPSLYMERFYEDDESLVDNILLWSRNSVNRLLFVEDSQKYDLFVNPRTYLMGGSSGKGDSVEDGLQQRKQLAEEFFNVPSLRPPDVEGFLYLKSDGRKTWKKYFFVLRASGIYYVAKGKSKASKDLTCLMSLEMNQVYRGINWKKKYKAPTDYGFALKHPQIQVKTSKFIKYLCAEGDVILNQWITGIRIAKHGKQLLHNFETAVSSVGIAKERNASMDSGLSSDLPAPKASIVFRPSSSRSTLNDSFKQADVKFTEQTSSPGSTKAALAEDGIGGFLGDQRGSCVASSDVQTPTASPEYSHALDASAQFAAPNGSNGRTSFASIGSLNAFEIDCLSTGTIKKRPSPVLPLTDTTQHIHATVLSLRNTSELSSSSSSDRSLCSVKQSGSTLSNDVELDSDEEEVEFPLPLRELLEMGHSLPEEFSHRNGSALRQQHGSGTQFNGNIQFASSNQRNNLSGSGVVATKRQSFPNKSTAPYLAFNSCSSSSTSSQLTTELDCGVMSRSASTSVVPVSAVRRGQNLDINNKAEHMADSKNAGAGAIIAGTSNDQLAVVKAKPAPPKRSDATRLSVVSPLSSIDNAVATSCSQFECKNSSGASSQSVNVLPTPPQIKPKPAVPSKSQQMPQHCLSGASHFEKVPSSVASGAVPDKVVFTSCVLPSNNGFMNDLQMAMQRRMQRQMTADPCNSGNGTTNSNERCESVSQAVVRSDKSPKVPPPPPPKRCGLTQTSRSDAESS